MSYCSDITKNRILECAKEEFLKKGFEKAQVGETRLIYLSYRRGMRLFLRHHLMKSWTL